MKRIAYLNEDSTLFKDTVQLSYRRRGFTHLSCSVAISQCPPVAQMKKGTKIKLELLNGRILTVELAR